MNTLTGFFTRLRRAFSRRSFEQQMTDEMKEHIDRETCRRIAEGEEPAEARRNAHIEFGGMDAHKERVRDHTFGHQVFDFWQATKLTLRRLRRSPAFTLTALITLALCIGANIAIFTVVDALVLRPLPFPEPERLVALFNSYPGAGRERAGPSIPNYFARREAIDALENVALFDPIGEVVGEPGNLRNIPGGRVTPEFFETLGVSLAMGHMFSDAELTYPTSGVVVITHDLWQSEYGGDSQIVGKTFMGDGSPKTIIGVLPAGFRFLSRKAQFFKPLAFNFPERTLANRHNSLAGVAMIGRLAPGATLTEAQAQLDALDARQAPIDPNGPRLAEWGYHSLVRPLHADYIREIRPSLLMLQGGVLLLLLIGAVNLTNLLLVRASGRGREFAVRQALGARRGHLARDAWLETVLLTLGGGALGLGLGAAGVRLLATLGARELPLGATITFDGRIAAIAMVATLILGSLLAAAPIWFTRSVSINTRLQSETTGSVAGGASQHLRRVFGTLQIALAFVLLCSAALLGVSLRRAQSQPVGFKPDNILVAETLLPWKGYPNSVNRVAFVARLEQELRTQPGVSAVSINTSLPFGGWVDSVPVCVENSVSNNAGTARNHQRSGVTSEYWNLMGIPMLRGQLTGNEFYALSTQRVCVIDQAMADFYWPGADPIGQRVSFGTKFDAIRAVTIIGVVGTVKQNQLTETAPPGFVYSPYVRFPGSWLRIAMRTKIPPKTMVSTVRDAFARLDPELLVSNFTTMEQQIEDSLQTRRSPAILTTIFAGVALLLATVGTYGVLAYSVSQRRREIGVRMALGALPRQILRLFLGMGGRLLLAGCILGMLGAWITGRAMQSFLFEVAPFPPGLIAGVAALMCLVVLIAIFIPAARAAAVDPSETLRHE